MDVFGLCLGGNVFGWTADRARERVDGEQRGAVRDHAGGGGGRLEPQRREQVVGEVGSLVSGVAGVAGGAVVDVYSNSSSAPNSASSTFLRRPSLTASATPAPTMPTSSSLPMPPRFFFFGSRSA